MTTNLITPAFNDCDKCIVLCSDNKFMPIAAVMLQSIVENSKNENKYDIIILHEDITIFTQATIANLFNRDNVSIRFYNVGCYINGKKIFIDDAKNLKKETCFKLLIPWVLDKGYNTALYVDGDMIVLKDIYNIFNYDLKDNFIGAVRDYWSIWNFYKSGYNKDYLGIISLYNIDNYAADSTIIFNIHLFREKYTVDQILELASSKKWLNPSQDILNVLCKDMIYYIDARWGLIEPWGDNYYLPEYLQEELIQAQKDPGIIHFPGNKKPWIKTYVDYFLVFWRYAVETPFFKVLFDRIRSNEYKNYVAYALFKEKHGEIVCSYENNDVKRYFNGSSLGELSTGHTRYRQMLIEKGILHLEGMVSFFGVGLESNLEIHFSINDKELVRATCQEREDGLNKGKQINTYRGESFKFNYKLDPTITVYNIKIICYLNGYPLDKTNLVFENFCPLSREYKNSYCQYEEWVITTNNKTLTINHIKSGEKKKYEIAFLKELVKTKKLPYIKAAIARVTANLVKPFIKKPIWLVSDRLSSAGDNGEVFFIYLNKKNDIYSFFVINDSKDFQRLQQYGKVIKAYSLKHKFLTLLADFIMSSQADMVCRNPFGKYFNAYKDILCKVKFVFLQHGVNSNDMSSLWKRNKQYLTGFIATTYKEYQDLLKSNYGYSKQEIWLTGLPRFDLLTDSKERLITIMPTWRRYLTTKYDEITGKRDVLDGFSESTYVKSYKSLLSNQKLKEWAKRLNYKIQFKIHPCLAAHSKAFKFDKDVMVVDENISSIEISSKSCLIVTDYSSAIYDFVYLNKPVIYYQFDIEEFFSGKHTYTKGDYDYELEGFGDVCYDEATLVDTIIRYMQNGCKLKDKYKERIEKSFAFHDKNNCQRIYEIIKTIDHNQDYISD